MRIYVNSHGEKSPPILSGCENACSPHSFCLNPPFLPRAAGFFFCRGEEKIEAEKKEIAAKSSRKTKIIRKMAIIRKIIPKIMAILMGCLAFINITRKKKTKRGY